MLVAHSDAVGLVFVVITSPLTKRTLSAEVFTLALLKLLVLKSKDQALAAVVDKLSLVQYAVDCALIKKPLSIKGGLTAPLSMSECNSLTVGIR